MGLFIGEALNGMGMPGDKIPPEIITEQMKVRTS